MRTPRRPPDRAFLGQPTPRLLRVFPSRSRTRRRSRLVSASPRVVGRPPPANDGRVENEGSRAFGVGGREQGGDRCAVPRTDQCSSFRARGVHDRSHIVHPFLERGRTEHGIRDPGASLVEEKDARERGERSVVVPPALELPAVVDVREEARNDHEVERALCRTPGTRRRRFRCGRSGSPALSTRRVSHASPQDRGA